MNSHRSRFTSAAGLDRLSELFDTLQTLQHEIDARRQSLKKKVACLSSIKRV